MRPLTTVLTKIVLFLIHITIHIVIFMVMLNILPVQLYLNESYYSQRSNILCRQTLDYVKSSGALGGTVYLSCIEEYITYICIYIRNYADHVYR